MNELLEILGSLKPGFDFTSTDRIVDDGHLTSLDIIQLVSAINDEFDVEVTVRDLIPENFNSVEAMMKMINRLEEE